jgi:hypothetical protein
VENLGLSNEDKEKLINELVLDKKYRYNEKADSFLDGIYFTFMADTWKQKYDNLMSEYLQMVLENKKLKDLLPEPQEVIWATLTEDGVESTTTLIVQPFVRVFKQKALQKKLNDEERKQLLEELEEFKKLSKELIETEHLEPDLLGDGNLEVVEKNGEYHVMLLDSGFINLNAPLPLTHTFMHLASIQTISNIENLIKKIL